MNKSEKSQKEQGHGNIPFRVGQTQIFAYETVRNKEVVIL